MIAYKQISKTEYELIRLKTLKIYFKTKNKYVW